MKFFKFYKVDASTGKSVEVESPVEGPTNPNLDNLGQVYEFGGWNYASADDTASADADNYIFEITEAEYIQVFKDAFDALKFINTSEAYTQEKGLRTSQFGKYGDTATVAGVYKYDLAKAYVADNTVDAGAVATEATARGLSTLAMANKIVTNHEAFRTTEAKIAGLRGKIVDRLAGLTFNESSVSDALASWTEITKQEKIGERDMAIAGDGDAKEDINVGHYSPSLSQRWENLS
jgi:hypothetical protein